MKNAQDAMSRLAAARPASLDPAPDPERRRRDLAGALAESTERRALLRRGTSRRLGLGLGLAAAATAVVLGAAALGSRSLRAPHDAIPGTSGPHGVLLVAAENAAAEPMGEYWHDDQIRAQTYLLKNGYAISGAVSESFEWTAAKTGGGNLFYGRDLPARPLTTVDEAAWRRAGSPDSFRVWSLDHWDTFTTKPGSWQADKRQVHEGGLFPFAGFENGRVVPMPCPKPVTDDLPCSKPVGFGATVEDLQKLSTDPRQLAARYMKQTPGQGADANAQRLRLVSDNLLNAPVSPKLRAAMMRMLPLLPGVYQAGPVTDPLGRPGFAIAVDEPSEGSTYHGYGSRLELMFSMDGKYLGDRSVLTKPGGEYRAQKPGFVLYYEVSRSSGWTDGKPTPPNKLPF
jgi:hypothetical protein